MNHDNSPQTRHNTRADSGQTTAEYALVLLGAVAIAGLLLAWAGQTSVITDLMNAVFSKIANLVK